MSMLPSLAARHREEAKFPSSVSAKSHSCFAVCPAGEKAIWNSGKNIMLAFLAEASRTKRIDSLRLSCLFSEDFIWTIAIRVLDAMQGIIANNHKIEIVCV